MIYRLFSGKPFKYENIFEAFLLLFSTGIAGYTIMDFPEELLEAFTTPVGQFFAFFAINYVMYTDDPDVTLLDMVRESIWFMIILQVLKIILNWYYD